MSFEPRLEVALLTGGGDRPYAFGLARALAAIGVRQDVIAGDNLTPEDFRDFPGVTLLKLRREPAAAAGLPAKARGILAYYARLIWFAATARPKVFHVLWNNKFETFDRVFLMLYYRLLGKRVVLTLHNVNTGARDATDTAFNRATLRIQYRLAHHILVHTEKMKAELLEQFHVSADMVTVIPFGLNNAAPQTSMTRSDARRRLRIADDDRAILFFGNIAPYKGTEFLIDAFRRVTAGSGRYRLIVAGRPKAGFEDYWDRLMRIVGEDPILAERTILRTEFIPDEDTEIYFKAADVLALPYTHVFQSGVLFLGYSFGLPVLATDVGSLKEDIVEGVTGFVVQPKDSAAFAGAIENYFASDLFADLDRRRHEIKTFVNTKYLLGTGRRHDAERLRTSVRPPSVQLHGPVEGRRAP